MLPNTIPPRTGRTRSPEAEEYLALWRTLQRAFSLALGSCTRFHGTRTGRFRASGLEYVLRHRPLLAAGLRAHPDHGGPLHEALGLTAFYGVEKR